MISHLESQITKTDDAQEKRDLTARKQGLEWVADIA